MGYYTKKSFNLSIFYIDIMIVKTFLALTKNWAILYAPSQILPQEKLFISRLLAYLKMIVLPKSTLTQQLLLTWRDVTQLSDFQAVATLRTQKQCEHLNLELNY